MDLRIFTEPQQGASYDTLLAVARAAEELDFDGFFRSDHYLKMGPSLAMGEVDGLPGPTDAWITLAGIAVQTNRIRLGTLMTAATFRLPGVLAIQVAQVDQMSGGRVELGLGAGWYGDEHRAYGIPFPKERFARLEEQLEIITGLWNTPVGRSYGYEGSHYRLTESPALPKPTQRKLPLLIGGHGTTRTPALAARYADEFNVPFASLEENRLQFSRVRRAAEEHGRDADDLVYSSALVACVGRSDAEVARRAAAMGRAVEDLRAEGLAGSPSEVLDKIERYARAGATRFYLRILDLEDLDHLELISSAVQSQLPS